MLKLTEAFGKHPIFVCPQNVVGVQKTDDCTLVFTEGNQCFEVLEDAEAIARYLVAKADWTGNDKYDTIEVRNINRADYPNEYEDVSDALDYAIVYLKKQIQESEEKEKNGDKVYSATIERFKELKKNIESISKRLVSVNVREVE